jgi:hypothetical protein
MAPVYHMTDSINLPWILASGELRPTWISDTGIGRTRFLWATVNPDGDLTSGPQIRIHGSMESKWRAGVFHLVRFTLAADEFFTWNEIVQASNWTPEEVAALIEDDLVRHGATDHQNWRLRHDPIPLSRILKVETTSYEDRETEAWWPLDIRPRRRGGVLLRANDPKRKGVRIQSRQFYSVPVNQKHHCFEPWLSRGERLRARYETYEDYLADARYA